MSRSDDLKAPPMPAAEVSDALRDFRAMVLIRRFEETVGQLLAERRLGGTTHLCIGQEACAVGVCSALGVEDRVVSNHRGHGHLLAKGGDPGRLLAELAGRVGGYCRGKGGSQHVAVPEIGFMGSNGITGGGIPIAVGLGLAAKILVEDRVVVSFFGDGACATGNFHECLNLASLWRLPVVFVCENNYYAMSHPVERGLAGSGPSDWARNYGEMPSLRVEGNDLESVAQAAAELVAGARAGHGPGFLELMTYRQCGHSRSDPRVYRSRDEEAWWRRHDPIALVEAKLLGRHDLTELAALRASVDETMEQAIEFAMNSPVGDRGLATGGVWMTGARS
ncbi:MAG: thiamine pyrophosphate-dependent dehydrogenase E1 component subunit alpha [Planctomycetes bacterium]|nr:thiamine pyrophosphate-dependent dehydrogenase E1 component subunit alpha [Planctomycetota bacterium]